MARVLLVTADRDLGFLVDIFLLRAGHEVEAILTPSAVAPRLGQPPPRAVVAEYAPGDGAGERVLADLRRHWPRCPVLLVAAPSAGVADAQEFGQVLATAQPAALLRRPVHADELLFALDVLVKAASSQAA
jgi:DNA-binding response OmpR family regulator